MIEGLFIALEGIDGAGTTTQLERLAGRLRERGLPVHRTREPSDGPIGTMIRQVLSGRIVVNGLQGPRPPSWTTMALLFAADRTDHVESEIVPNLMDGVNLVCIEQNSLGESGFTRVDMGTNAYITNGMNIG